MKRKIYTSNLSKVIYSYVIQTIMLSILTVYIKSSLMIIRLIIAIILLRIYRTQMIFINLIHTIKINTITENIR